ncbi:MAG: DNA-directed RNA polymerase subunit beta [Candidatus Gracilibacteria bacterium]|nr:DNA-directed RNA polymerase subunit beta [Candidatus Gracilibacteria bacterium]MDD2908965.1 DNA-directed RNA polymerase subunit beta [Candidatus Gracilibacteria bacterium]
MPKKKDIEDSVEINSSNKSTIAKGNENLGALYEIKGRYYFTDDKSILEIPELIEVQLNSYKDFLDTRLNRIFDEVFPISDFSGEKIDIYYKSMNLEEPKYSVTDCKRKNLNYEAPLKIRLEMLNKETGEIKEQDVYMGGIPLMTEMGSFVINGIERVIVNQIIRSTGMFFSPDSKNPGSFAMKVIPQKGSWFEVEVDKKGVINVKIDKKRKIPISTLLRAFGLETDADIIGAFKGNKDFVAKYIGPTIDKDKTKTRLDALHVIYKLLRPGDLGTDERVQDLFNTTFFDIKKFDLGEIARIKTNRKLGLDVEYKDEGRFLQLNDLIQGFNYLLSLNEGKEGFSWDDIDHLENRRVRSVGELVYDKIKVGLARIEKIAKDRMTIVELEDATPGTFINSRPLTAVMKEFFASSQLSQFMDQSNPVSELAHKRIITALGPGGLTRERASFEVRDVHPTQYGRICPIHTPEGPNIGLVLHLASYAKVDKFGFITTPFQKVSHSVLNDGVSSVNRITHDTILDSKGKVIVEEKVLITEEIAKKLKESFDSKEISVRGYPISEFEYFDAYQERVLTIAEANVELDEYGNFTETRLGARKNSEPVIAYEKEVTYKDISPKQIMSETTTLIPFLEHDDATRAEMGTNMMRQAVPLIRTESPIVGTGTERVIGEGSGYIVKADEDGEIIGVDAKHISVLYKSGNKKLYELRTFEKSNDDMHIHQKALVSTGDKIKAGDILADGQSIENGELAIGKNLLVAYMPWGGYNFEDAIILSSRVMENDLYTSVHISEYVLDVRETKLGPEQTTDDIPNVSTAKLSNLNEDGIIRIGSSVKGGDILVGKVTPKGEIELSPEERLLRAIFGDKSKDVKDSSLILPSGTGGKVIGIHILKRELGDNLPTGVFKQVKVFIAETRKIEVGDKMAGRHGNKGIVSRIVPEEDMPFMADGTHVDIILNPLGVISRMNIGQILETHLGYAAQKLGIKVATPILNGIEFDMIGDLMEKAGLPRDGKLQLFDGKTGEPFKEKTMVGVKYMLKLHHLVEDKIHARSVGPYSMVTQQPLGGKAQNGGQRFGEMEVWALEGYGAANILQEMITIKSDDITGRTQSYEAIVKQKRIKRPNMPESFNVLLRELQALNLSLELLDKDELDLQEELMYQRFQELEKLEGQYDIEMDTTSSEIIKTDTISEGREDIEE